MRRFELIGLDGANPLGFLAALGTLVSLAEARAGEPRLAWRAEPRWQPILEGVEAEDEEELSLRVAESLRGATVDADAESRRTEAQKEMERAKTAVKKKRDEIKRRRLRGIDRTTAVETELRPLEDELLEKRRRWLQALKEAVPRPELALGKRIDCTPEEYRQHAAELARAASLADRGALDMLAAFGSDACYDAKSGAIEPTPFCFITGSGNQFFLQTALELMSSTHATGSNVFRVLFRPWDYRDERLSMRWDPLEDRRYALMDRDPTASDNEPRTMWMANLLAYRALALFPTAPVGKQLRAAGWDKRGASFTWPLWEHPLGVDGVRSLVAMRELCDDLPDPDSLRARGVAAVYRARRIAVGDGANKKVNFAPARRVV